MAAVSDILLRKGHLVATVREDTTVLEAVQLMNDRRIGAVIVVDEAGRLMGMFTERDVLRRVVAVERLPREVTVGAVMTTEVACCRPETTVDEVQTVMAHHRIRHLPVCSDDGRIHGIVSIGDINAWESHGKEQTIHWLNEYIAGRI